MAVPMNVSYKRIHALILVLTISLLVIASCLSAAVLARKRQSANVAVAAPATSGNPEPNLDRATHGMPPKMLALQSLAFETNEGQADETVKFLARTGRHQLLLTSDAAILRSPQGTIRIEFAGANESAKVAGVDPLPGQRNYLLGNDRKNWHTGIPTHQRVLYTDLYPGIDLTFYGNQSEFEYDFIVKPGADPDAIRLQLDPQTRARISRGGDLVLRRGDFEVIQRKPNIYQDVDGERRAAARACRGWWTLDLRA